MKPETFSWVAVMIHAATQNPIEALAMLIAVLALLVALAAINRK